MNRRFEIEPWHLITHRFEPQYQRLTESLTSLGNGYMGGRGFFEEGYSGDSLPGIYVGGIWFPDKTKVGWWKNGYPDYFGKAANVPNFLALSVWVDETPLDLNHASITDFTLDLDLHQGLLTRRFTLHQGGHRIAMTFQRFFDQTVPELAVQRLTLANLGTKPVPIRLESTIEPQVQNESAHQPDSYWHIQAQAPTYLQVQTKANAFQVPQFTLGIRSETHYTGMGPVQEKSGQSEPAFKGVLKPDAPLTVVKHTVVVTSRDVPENQLATRTKTMLAAQAGFDFDTLLERQTAAWARRWENCDVVIKGDGQAQQALRFNLFQLWSTYDGRDEGLNIGPKGFSGEKYGGGTYWDTEAFVLPYYLGAAVEKVARNLFEYRYAQLPQAYENAAQLGLKGALFPMVTFDGIENHNEWEITFEELHRNSTIAFAIYNYTRYTGDQRFLWTNGIEVLVGIARFWADRVSYSPRKKQYVLLGVTGPNEFENNVNNNWYTNYMARWVLQYTLSVLKEVPAPKLEKLGVSPQEQASWGTIAEKLYLPTDAKTGIFPQQDGFFDKTLSPAASIPADQRPINQHWSWDRILRSPYIKQADVLQAFWYFPEDFTTAVKRRNFDFYEPMTVHESSLSAGVHGILAADLGKLDQALMFFTQATRLDLDNYNNDTGDGLHITSMTGGWLTLVQGFAGVGVDSGQLVIRPQMPAGWQSYAFRLQFRGRQLAFQIKAGSARVQLLAGPALTILVAQTPVPLQKGVEQWVPY